MPRREPLDRPLEHRLAAPRPRTRPTARPPPARRSARYVLTSLRLLSVVVPSPARGRRARRAPRRSPGRVNARNALAAARGRSSQPAISPSTAASSSSVGTRRNSGRPIAALGPEAAAHEDVVGLPPLARPRRARSCPGSRGRRPSAGRRRAGSRRGGAAARRSASPKRCLELVDQRVRAASSSRRPRSCSAARRCRRSRSPRSGLTSSGKPIAVERGRGLVDLVVRDAR